jgi:hypothetical protein
MILLVCTEGEQMEECDDTTSPNDNSAPENDDSGFEPNYSLSVDSYSGSSNRTVHHCMRSTTVY